VRVWDRSSLDRRVYLPFVANDSCFRGADDLDVVLVMDSSESMSETDASGRTKLAAAREAALIFLGLLRLPEDQEAVEAFHDSARVAVSLTGDRARLGAALDGLSVSAGTRIDRGLLTAAEALADGRRSEARPVVVLLTDGLHRGAPDEVLQAASALRRQGITVYTIGLGQNVDAELLRAVAGDPAGFFAAPTPEELADAYRRVAHRVECASEMKSPTRAARPSPFGHFARYAILALAK
jgi:hypothetical protein